MKRLFYILIPLILIGFKSGEKLKGRFYNHTAFDKIEYFDFKSNGKFEYYAECEYEKYGYGKYQLKNDKLILEYLTKDYEKKGHFDILGYKIATQYSDTIIIHIHDLENSKPLDSATVHYIGTRNATISDSSGGVRILRKNNDLRISLVPYRNLLIPKEKIIDKGIMGFNVFLQDWGIYFVENICDTIDINFVSKDTLKMYNSIYVKDIESNKMINCE